MTFFEPSKTLTHTVSVKSISDNTLTNITIDVVSEDAMLITWPEGICATQHQQIIYCQQLIQSQLSAVIFETIPAYNSLMVYYHFQQISLIQCKKKLIDIIAQLATFSPNNTSENAIEIPVYYGEEAGWDLKSVAQKTQISTENVIQLHSQQTYNAYALGFTPGFCYLGSLSEKLILPRKSKPRLNIPKGAVAIAEQQTAVYPSNSPGGWHILGQTPMPMYNSEGQKHNVHFTPTISVGTKVKFRAIDYETFCKMGGVVEYSNEKGEC